MFRPGEHAALVRMVKALQPKVMLEIGVHAGGTARIMLQEVESLEHYYGVDVTPSYQPGLRAQQKEVLKKPGHLAASDPRFTLITKPRGSFDVRPNEIGFVDIAFIDGDHSEEAVRWDTTLAHTVVKKGGMIIWHDYTNPAAEVTQVLDEYRHQGFKIRPIPGTWLAVEQR